MLRSLTIAIGLDRIAVAGGFAQSLGQTYVNILTQTMHEQNSFPGFPQLNGLLELCEIDHEIGLLGAATYAHRRLGAS